MGRSPCCDESGLKKGPWTPEEDEKLIDYINKHGHGSWRALPKLAGLNRCGKSCRLRWTNYLRPDIKRGKFSPEEEQTILNLHAMLGNKWSTIATHLPGRTDNEIKNYWNTNLKKKLIQLGFDPMTHRPRTDVFSSLPHLIALANLKHLLENLNNNNSPSWLQNDQMAKIENLQYLLLQPPPHDQLSMVSTFPNSTITPDIDTINFLNSITSSSMKENQLILNQSSNSFLDGSFLQAMHDHSIPFSHLPGLQQPTPCSYPMSFENKDGKTNNNNNNQVCTFNIANENSPPPWLHPSLSTSSPPPLAANRHHAGDVVGNSNFNQDNQSIVWPPELFMDDSFFPDIS
ncbi:hypothetical protein Leryth_015245 [Lithospermum erythrorhizon]|uniref:Homeodomain transcription factor n=1 Tax=Lithospermum erythrorhizon TaxID=34254 RepID=A0AAV3QBK5_LITER|nr:hypothetical protein Leryth_015245 [Lithospermum erythrorhizon]